MEKNKLFDKIKTVREIADAEKDIRKIESVLNDSQFNSKSIKLYDELDEIGDYKTYIAILKTKRGLAGKQSFGSLSYLQRRNVLIMIKDAIKLYIAKELKDLEQTGKESKTDTQ